MISFSASSFQYVGNIKSFGGKSKKPILFVPFPSEIFSSSSRKSANVILPNDNHVLSSIFLFWYVESWPVQSFSLTTELFLSKYLSQLWY